MFRFIFIAALFVALLTIPALAHTNLGMKQSLLAPVVQVTTPFGGGSGTMVRVKGEYTYITTNFHVIAGVMTYDAPYNKRHLLHHTKPLTIVVTTYNGDHKHVAEFAGEVMATYRKHDIALVRIKYKSKHLAILGKSKDVRVFDTTWACGGGLGAQVFCTSGYVSLLSLVTGRADKPTMLMQSAPTINGFSGGALYRKVGKQYHYIGMNTVVAGYRNSAVVFMGGAVPVDLVKDFIGSNL